MINRVRPDMRFLNHAITEMAFMVIPLCGDEEA